VVPLIDRPEVGVVVLRRFRVVALCEAVNGVRYAEILRPVECSATPTPRSVASSRDKLEAVAQSFKSCFRGSGRVDHQHARIRDTAPFCVGIRTDNVPPPALDRYIDMPSAEVTGARVAY
jgi:hypothetical protein